MMMKMRRYVYRLQCFELSCIHAADIIHTFYIDGYTKQKSSGEDKEDEDKDDRSSDDDGKSKMEGICHNPNHDLDKKYCDELCNICDPNEVLCCNCLGCPGWDDGDITNDQQNFLRGQDPEFQPGDWSCKRTLTHQDLAVLYDYFQDENQDGVFLGCPVCVLYLQYYGQCVHR